VKCNYCGENITEFINSTPVEHTDCPFCGKRTYLKELKAEVRLTPALYKLANWFRGGRSRSQARFHRREGDSYTVSTGKWNYLIRIIDKVHDWYYELVVDSRSGKELHKREHLLSEHQGYGSAKKKHAPTNDDDA